MSEDLLSFEQNFDINKVSFDNVSNDFERKFKETYAKSLNMMSDSASRLTNGSGANALGLLEKMAQRMDAYDKTSSFKDSFEEMLEEYGPFLET